MSDAARRVALWFNHDPGVIAAAARLAGLLRARGLEARVDTEFAPDPRFEGCGGGFDGCDAMITLGGDGTLLRGCREAVARGIPVGGINMGHVGFLTSLEAGEELACADALATGRMEREKRMTLQADAPGGPLALNDCAITRGPDSRRILSLEVRVNGALVCAYAGDGLVIATPTGSTSYSLAAGGPIAHPDMALMLLTPVCPHALNARPLIVSPDSEVTVEVTRGSEGRWAMDGHSEGTLGPGDRVTVRRGRRDAELLRFGRIDFYERLRSKLTGIGL